MKEKQCVPCPSTNNREDSTCATTECPKRMQHYHSLLFPRTPCQICLRLAFGSLTGILHQWCCSLYMLYKMCCLRLTGADQEPSTKSNKIKEKYAHSKTDAKKANIQLDTLRGKQVPPGRSSNLPVLCDQFRLICTQFDSPRKAVRTCWPWWGSFSWAIMSMMCRNGK